MSLKNLCTCSNCQELKKLIVENPDLPLIVFCSEDAANRDYSYTLATNISCEIDYLTLYNDEKWLDEEYLVSELYDDYSDERENMTNMTYEEYNTFIDEKVDEYEFIKAIVIYVR